MFRKISNNYEILKIKQVKYIYKVIERRKKWIQYSMEPELKKNRKIFLTRFFERDIFALESCNLDTLYLIGKKNLTLSNDVFNCLNPNQILAYKLGKFFGKKIYFHLKDLIYLLRSILIWVAKFIISFIDFISIVFYSIFRSINLSKKKYRKKAIYKNKSIKEIYTIFYWDEKKANSIYYYYPKYRGTNKQITFVNMFNNYKFIIKGIQDVSKEKEIIDPFDFITLSILKKSLKDLFFLYYFDLSTSKTITYGDILGIFFTYRMLNRRIYSLIILNLFPKIIEFISPESIYIWNENQFHHKTLCLSIPEKRSLGIKIYNYIGSLFSQDYYPYLIPSKLELKYRIWGENNFLMQDQDSKEEINHLLKKFKIKHTVNVMNKRIKRLNIKNYNLENQFKYISYGRYITLFSHANPNELYIILMRLNQNFLSKLNLDKNLKIFIRLHPLCSKSEAIRKINKFRLKTSNYFLKFIFIENDKENISDSMINSEYCVFGESSYINIALNIGIKVIGIRTSFFYNPPLQIKYKKYKNLKIF
tara:strand:+ start:2205 stop:3803 length:1599 start_codon:yes stop_codon:yes gene_type:complete